MDIHAQPSPSSWVRRFAAAIPPGCSVLDVACGQGRHARYLAALGHRVEAVDRDVQALAALRELARVAPRLADLESGPWPYRERSFDAVVVTNYLHRPRLPLLLATLRPGGVLIYETFMLGNERYGKPSNPDFLLRPGELLDVVRNQLTVLAFEQGLVESQRCAMIQRLCAVRAGLAHEAPLFRLPQAD